MQTAKKVVGAVSEMGHEAVEKVRESTTGTGGGAEAMKQGLMTRMTGCPVGHMKNSMTAGPYGPVLMQDDVLIEKLSEFDREKIPARNVHALGTGAYGRLRITKDISKYCKADVFSGVGKETDLFVRFSGIFTEQGDPETLRDPRGFALKFYTKEGNWDLLAINTPVFAVRDGKVGPDNIHSFKRDPRTSNWNPNQTWDFVANHPEGLHQTLMMYSDRDGTPMSFRYMHAWGCNTFSMTNSNNERYWVKFHLRSTLGAKGFDQEMAKLIAGEDTNFLSRDLREAIDRKSYPKWILGIQVMPEEEGYKHAWTFDCTKIWKHADYPVIEFGEIELNRNPIDYFAEVEQVAFSPMNVVPGIGFSPDKLLQGRLLIYDDTQHHRLGPNFKQLEINRPHGCKANTMRVGGFPQLEIQNNFPHYWPNSYGGPQPDSKYMDPPFRCDGPAGFYDYPGEGSDADYYAQPRDFLKCLKDTDYEHLCQNIGAAFAKIDGNVAQKNLDTFFKVDQKFGDTVQRFWREYSSGSRKKTLGEMVWDKANNMLKSDAPTSE